MSNLTELKRVVSALGGTPAESDTNDESIGKIADALENGSGGGGGVLVVHETTDEDSGITTLDKTWQELFDAKLAICLFEREGYFRVSIMGYCDSDDFAVGFTKVDGGSTTDYTSESANSYPVSGGGDH